VIAPVHVSSLAGSRAFSVASPQATQSNTQHVNISLCRNFQASSQNFTIYGGVPCKW